MKSDYLPPYITHRYKYYEYKIIEVSSSTPNIFFVEVYSENEFIWKLLSLEIYKTFEEADASIQKDITLKIGRLRIVGTMKLVMIVQTHVFIKNFYLLRMQMHTFKKLLKMIMQEQREKLKSLENKWNFIIGDKMKLKDFLKNIEKMVKEDPRILELEVITAKDDEGNGFDDVYHTPSVGNYEDGEFQSGESEYYDLTEDLVNAICIN